MSRGDDRVQDVLTKKAGCPRDRDCLHEIFSPGIAVTSRVPSRVMDAL